MTRKRAFGLFEVTGIELEYMIVDAETLSVRPVADELIKAQAGAIESEIEVGEIAWSNELVLHVIEFKTNGPADRLAGLANLFQANVERANALLAPMGARLMPTAMHPWMDPHAEMVLWPHEFSPVYESFHRIFDCRGHGWANLQSVHVNLPFGNDDEFGRLHAAIRLALPILPALAASSPVADGMATGFADTRMEYYRKNARRVPSVSGRIVPEPVFTRADYEGRLLQRLYDDIAPHDPDGVLQEEWLNARGCIARFDRSAIEIRVIDVGECPLADLAVSWAVISLLRALVEERFEPYAAQTRWPVDPLADLLLDTARDGDAALVRDEAYLRALGWEGAAPARAGDLWRHLIDTTGRAEPGTEPLAEACGVILDEGCLSRRILARLGPEPGRERLRDVWGELCECLAAGRLFRASS